MKPERGISGPIMASTIDFPPSPDPASSSSKDRSLRLQSAKQKLKSYRAKQAQMERAKRQSNASSSTTASPAQHVAPRTSSLTSSSSIQSLQDVVRSPAASTSRASILVGGIVSDAARESNQRTSSQESAPLASSSRRHSRNMSRSNPGSHVRGHSRAGSISLSQPRMMQQVVNRASIEAASVTPSARPVSTFIANLASSHTRGHSRSGSRSLAASAPRSRPSSFIAPKIDSAASTAKEDGIDQQAWHDVSNDAPAVLEPSPFKTPQTDNFAFDSMNLQTPQSIADNASSIGLTPPPPLHARLRSPSTPAGIPASPASPNTATTPSQPTHARRASRHARKGSVSTRKESMEIMGGLGSLGINAAQEAAPALRHSRRISSQRWSGLQPASVLFGDDFGSGSRRASTDWRSSFFESASYDQDTTDRHTALDKLEGRESSAAGQRHSRQQSSVQLPSFDDVHGDVGMDKRASLNLLEANEKSTQSSSHLDEHGNDRLLATPHAGPSRGLLSPNPPSTTVTSPLGVEMQTSVDSNGGEGLGTLMEEEEEEEDSVDSSLALRETGSVSMDAAVERDNQRRKDMELEVQQRTRRLSLQPKPLKLKSRPSSMYGVRAANASNSALSPRMVSMDIGVDAHEEIDNSTTPKAAQTEFEASAETRSASPATKRAWRASMPAASFAAMAPLAQRSPNSSVGSRSGMRALRLSGSSHVHSTSSSAASLDVTSAIKAQHKPHADSTSSATSSASQASSLAPRRSSLLYHTTPVSFSREEAGPLTTPLNRRSGVSFRSSVIGTDTSPATTVEASSPYGVAAPAKASSATTSGVPFHLFEELKARHQRDVTALSEARESISQMEADANVKREHAFYELREMERWSAEEKRSLNERIEHLEANLAQVTQRHEEREAAFTAKSKQLSAEVAKQKSDYDDVEAERDMLREDVDGWRQRCSDLERQLMTEKTRTDDIQQLQSAGKLRIRELLDVLREKGLHVAHKSIDDDVESITVPSAGDLIAMRRSPALGSHRQNSSRGSSVSPGPTDIEGPPPQQTIQLLKSMRQQIFNLAGSLEHERKQHLQARKEANELKLANERFLGTKESEPVSDAAESSMPTFEDSAFHLDTDMDIHAAGESDPSSLPTSSSEPMIAQKDTPAKKVPSTAGSSPSQVGSKMPVSLSSPPRGPAGQYSRSASYSSNGPKVRKHVFAYDSSMESGLGSFSAGGSASTHQTSEWPFELGNISADERGKSASDDAAAFQTKLLAEASGELHGLGVTSLDTLEEEEEVNAESCASQGKSSLGPEAATSDKSLQEHHDLEAGSHAEVESLAPSTPGLEQSSLNVHTLIPASTKKDTHADKSLSAASSQDSSDLPRTPCVAPGLASTSGDTVVNQSARPVNESFSTDFEEDEDEEDLSHLPAPAPRPEFIREWSFQKAIDAVSSKKEKPKLRMQTTNLLRPGMKRSKTTGDKPRRNKNGSIDDFFGIMRLDEISSLPPLPTPEEALDMPPLIFTDPYDPIAQSGNYYGALGSSAGPRMPSIRPPVSKTSRMYGRSSLSDRSSGSGSSNGSWSKRTHSPAYALGRHSPLDTQRASTMPIRAPQQQQHHQDASASSGMFGRVFSLTSGALSGLGGYIYGPSQPSPSSAHGSATNRGFHIGAHLDAQSSASWAVSRRDEEMV